MGLIVVGVMLVLLFLAFGSLVLPVKAIVMNLLSITASFGVVTWIFAEGHLSGLLGFEPQGFLDATNPILMLAILFGLSMDYEVFLLSRIREQWDRTGDNDLAVATGVQKTGRIITSAALLLAVVIGAFALSGIVFMKMLGIGMLVALLIDATVVRALLVPGHDEAARPLELVGARSDAPLVGAARLPRGRRRRLGGTLPRPRAGRRLGIVADGLGPLFCVASVPTCCDSLQGCSTKRPRTPPLATAAWASSSRSRGSTSDDPDRELAARRRSSRPPMAAPSGSTRTPSMVTPRSDAGGNDGWTPTNRPPSRTSATACSWSTAASATVSQPVVGSAVKSAPRPRTNSSSAARASPVTRQPRSSASCDDVAADGAGGAGHEQGAALAVAEDVDELQRGERVERDGGRLDQVEAVRYDGHVGGRQHQLLGVRAEVAVEPADQARPPASPAPGRRPAPASRTVPAKSQPRPVCSGWSMTPAWCSPPPRTRTSTGLTVAAATATRT